MPWARVARLEVMAPGVLAGTLVLRLLVVEERLPGAVVMPVVEDGRRCMRIWRLSSLTQRSIKPYRDGLSGTREVTHDIKETSGCFDKTCGISTIAF
jgi:hypothetical protein